MKNRTILKLQRKMNAGAKSIAVGDKAIEAIKETQAKVISDFAKEVTKTVKNSEKEIAHHSAVIEHVEGLSL